MRLLELVLLAILQWLYQKAKACQGLNIARSAAQRWSKIYERMEVKYEHCYTYGTHN